MFSESSENKLKVISGNVITLNSAVTLTVGAHTAIDYDDYTTNTTDQQDGAAYISDSTHSLSNSDEGHRYT